jgi:hypothetical protein
MISNNNFNVAKLRLLTLKLDKRISNNHSEQLAVIDRAIGDAARTVARVRELGRTRERASK